jgi:hypothetical protein
MPRTLIRGRGPGPYNVLIEEDDGRKVVVTYRRWKWHYRYFDNDIQGDTLSEYRCVMGIVQFPPREGEASGKPVRNVRINQIGFKEQAIPVSLTLWPSHKDFEVEENDVIIAEGKYERNAGGDKVYHNLSVIRIAKLGVADPGERPDVDSNDVPADAGDDDIPF